MVEAPLSKETKARKRAPWSKALIAKVYDRTVNTLWSPRAKMDCVDLGKDFFLIKFNDNEDCDKVLRGGPWFIGEHFLAIKPWEPYFKALEALFTSILVWVRFPELPIEFYDAMVLKKIGSAIGPVLRIDSYPVSGSRRSYARLCIQVDLDKPLINIVKIGRLRQKVMYEGISSLCFCCRCIGHKNENCCYEIQPKKVEAAREEIMPTSPKESQVEDM
nr:uncharacterized protein LOC112025751 [Quercus suber]